MIATPAVGTAGKNVRAKNSLRHDFERLAKGLVLGGLLILTASCARTPKLQPLPGVPPTSAALDISETELLRASVDGHLVPDFHTRSLISWGPLPAGSKQMLPPLDIDLIHQMIRVTFDWSRNAVVGSTTLTFTALEEPISSVTLDAVNMDVKQVSSNGVNLEFANNREKVKIFFPEILMPRQTFSLTVDYETISPKKGVYFVPRKGVVWTQGEMIETRHWVPTIDRPDDKTTWEMFITVPRSQKALSNGRLVAVRELGDSHEWHWKQELPASTYLFSAVTGDYTIIKEEPWFDVSISYWTYPDSIEAARRGFARTRDMMAVFAKRTGMRYPWNKYDQIAVPDFIYGGMENVTASTQNDKTVLIPLADSSRDAQGLVAHELAHQWFGNLVTLKDWSDAWLNEGFATFFQTIFWEDDGQADRAALSRVKNQQSAIAADRRSRRPLVYGAWNKDPVELFLSGHVYPKGAAVLDMLRVTVGEPDFWKGVNRYLTQNAYKNVTTADLKRAFEEASGKDLTYFFNQWVYKAGVPAFQIAHRYDEENSQLIVTVIQSHPRDSLTDFFAMDVELEATNGQETVRRTAYVRGETTIVNIPLSSAPLAIRWDPDNRWLNVYDFPRSPNMLMYQLQKGDLLARREAIELLAPWIADPNIRTALGRVATHDPVPALRTLAQKAVTP